MGCKEFLLRMILQRKDIRDGAGEIGEFPPESDVPTLDPSRSGDTFVELNGDLICLTIAELKVKLGVIEARAASIALLTTAEMLR